MLLADTCQSQLLDPTMASDAVQFISLQETSHPCSCSCFCSCGSPTPPPPPFQSEESGFILQSGVITAKEPLHFFPITASNAKFNHGFTSKC